MITDRKNKMLVWLVVLLIAVNLSTILTLWIRSRGPSGAQTSIPAQIIDNQSEMGVHQFREHLNLDSAQVMHFREVNRNFNRTSHQITRELESLRIEMVRELAKEFTDLARIKEINHDFGRLHEQLKNITAEYYLDMKSVCNDQQKEQLFHLFNNMVQKDTSNYPPGRRRGYGFGRRAGRPVP